jgi:CBS domain-containing protein
MMKAYEVMTHALATASPDASVSTVAAIMRDRDIGDVLIMEDGKLRGIVTDRDLAIQALTGQIDPTNTPITKYMNSKVVKGDADWSVEKVGEIMAKNQIRRLPIMRNDQLVGIVSLGDLSQVDNKKDMVSRSLQAISRPVPVTGRMFRSGAGSALTTLLLLAGVASLALWLTMHPGGKQFRKQVSKSDIYNNATDVVSNARDKVGEVATSKQVRQLTHQVRSNISDLASNLNDLASHMPMMDGKALRRRHTIFG